MALKLSFPFPIFAPAQAPSITPIPYQTHYHAATEIRFSRWNNANAEKFNERKRAIKEIEDEIRSRRRYESASRIAAGAHTNASAGNETFRSTGTPSAPSRPSIPGKKSKYSKNPNPPDPNPKPNFTSHPAFQQRQKATKLPDETPISRQAKVTMSESGVSYVVDGAPFEFKYSYTETPKVKPLKLREAPFAPFGPTTLPRPWTGQKPLPPSKKEPVEFDSFKLPPPHKKGVKPVQKPGPFLHGSGPKYVRSREEILGEPLTKMEIHEMVKNCGQSRRVLHMGRDGLTHNMLDNVHALWKRRRLCKIKCIGVCTVDMENVCQQLEEKTGGKVIHRTGGVLYLFRGRNYNYKTRPRYPLMLWKPVAPVYPRLIKQVPEGLTLEEATEMRKKGLDLIPICKLGKNGAYYDLVKNVREAFEECELIRINCQGLNGSDYRKIGAKLQDLVPCVLISFAEQHILMWRGQNWKSSLPEPIVDLKEANNSNFDDGTSVSPPLEAEELTPSHISAVSVKNACSESLSASMHGMNLRDVSSKGTEDPSSTENGKACTAIDAVSVEGKAFQSETISDKTLCNNGQSKAVTNSCESATILANTGCAGEDSGAVSNTGVYESILDNKGCAGDDPAATVAEGDTSERVGNSSDLLEPDISVATKDLKSGKSNTACTEGILQLLRQAVDGGSAVVLDDANLDADLIYQRAVALAQIAPPGPAFRRDRPRRAKVAAQESKNQETRDAEAKEVIAASQERGSEKKSSKLQRKRDFDDRYIGVVKHGSLRVDELAKLLA